VPRADSQRFWDERARENALYFVDNRVDYRDADDERFWRGGDEVLDIVCELLDLELRPDEVVLDIGCGVGRMTRALRARVGRVIGIDVSSEMLARARTLNAHLSDVEWLHGDGSTLHPVADASVDGCFSHVVFQHLPDPATTLGYVREMGRVLRPGGWAAFQVSTDPAVHSPRRRPVRARLKAAVRPGVSWGSDPAWLGSAVSMGELRAASAEAGLGVERVANEGTQFTLVRLRSMLDRDAPRVVDPVE
jgi:SAM-dependent methyltransferase